MKFYYMRISHMRVKWNEICYIPIRYQFFAGLEDLVPIIHFAKCEICGSRTCFRVLEDLVPICVNSTHLKKNHTSSSQTLYKFVPSETDLTFEILVLISPPPPRHRNLTYINGTLPKCALLVPIFLHRCEIKKCGSTRLSSMSRASTR